MQQILSLPSYQWNNLVSTLTLLSPSFLPTYQRNLLDTTHTLLDTFFLYNQLTKS